MKENKTISMAIKRKFPTVAYDDRLETAIRKMTEYNVSVLAVKIGKQLAGLVTISDVMFCMANEAHFQQTEISSLMTKCDFNTSQETRNPCIQLDENEDPLKAIKLMYEAGVNHLLVSGADGKAIGIVSSLEIIKLFGSETI